VPHILFIPVETMKRLVKKVF